MRRRFGELAAEAFSKRSSEGDVLILCPWLWKSIDHRSRPSNAGIEGISSSVARELSPRDQDAAVASYDQPKVVVATNVAETSITIDGVSVVIDSGLARIHVTI
jgi:ATP-dependent helicase HrpB